MDKKKKNALQREKDNHLRERKQKYESLFKNMPTGFAHHKIIFDEAGNPVDFIFLKANKKFEDITGLKKENVINQKGTNLLKNIINNPLEFMQLCGEVALNGQSKSFEGYSKFTDKWYEVKIFSQKKGYFTTIFNDITDRKKKEEKLKEKNERLNNIFNNSNDIIYSLSWPDLQIKFVSKAVEDIFGYTTEEFKTNASLLRDITHPDDKYIHDEALTKLEEEGFAKREFRIITKEGNVKWMYEKGKMIYDEKNKPIRTEGVLRDVTERKILENKLKYNKKMYETIFNSTPIGMIIEDKNGDIIKVNEAECEMTGYTKEELEGSNVIDKFVLPEQHELAKKNIKKILKGQDIELDIKTPKKNRDIVYMHLKETNITFPDGTKGIISMHLDITERKQIEKQLAESEERLQRMLSVIPDMVSLQDPEMNILYSNWSGFGLVPEEKKVLNTKCYKTYRGFDSVCPDCKAKLVLKTKEPFKDLVKLPDGTWADLRVLPILDDDNNIEFFVEWVRDITELRQKEKIIKSLHKIALDFKQLSDKKEVCKSTVEAAENLLQFDICDINLVEDEMLIPQAKTDNANNKKMAITEGIAGKTYREGESFLIDNVENSPEAKPVKSSYKSVISIPIGDYGVFQAVAEKEAAFTEADLELAELLISHMTAALERIYFQEKLKYKTFHDELTGLYNRRFIEEEIKRLDTKRQLPISIIMADINGLKIINDSLGHAKGDELLVKTANLLEKNVREEDILSRYGGDEFIIFLPQTSQKKARDIVGRIKKSCKKTKTEELIILLGVGVATKSDPKEDIKNIIKKADNNLYEDKLMSSRSTKHEIVENLLNTLAANSSETKGHARRMKELAQKLGTKIGLNKSQLNSLLLLATLHDIGKITISSDILTKPDKLTEEEWQLLKKHPEKGHKIVSASDKFAIIAEEILYHHEHYNGKGYPEGLAGEEIPLLARVIAIVDAYDVMTTGRPYKEAMSKEETLKEIKSCAGTQFDPKLAEEFVEIMSK